MAPLCTCCLMFEQSFLIVQRCCSVQYVRICCPLGSLPCCLPSQNDGCGLRHGDACQMHAAMEDRDRVQQENANLQQELGQLQQERDNLVQDNVKLQQEMVRLERENVSIWEDYEKGAAQMKVCWLTH